MDARWKLLAGVVLLAAIAALTLRTSEAADPPVHVHDVAADPESFEGRTVTVLGNVAANASVGPGGVTFRLADLDPAEPGEILVTYTGVLPDAFGAKAAAVTGTLELRDGVFVLEAQDIRVGCSSKY